MLLVSTLLDRILILHFASFFFFFKKIFMDCIPSNSVSCLNSCFFSGKISSWIDLDSEDEALRMDSETTLKQEIAWANHLSVQVNFNPEI